MIVLDTNILSALMGCKPDPIAVAWLDDQPAETIWTTSITVFEVRFGLERLPVGRRRRQLEVAFSRAIAEDLCGRILPFDEEAARQAAGRAAESRHAGRRIDLRNLEIAGIVSARRATLATRNIRHFQQLDIDLVDPWRIPYAR